MDLEDSVARLVAGVEGANARRTFFAINSIPTFRPLSALLSQVLVAFTVEFDSEFQHRMHEAGYHGTLSLTVWTNLMRFVGEGVTVRDLAAAAAVPGHTIKFRLGCLERWGFVVLRQDALHPHSPLKRREGWGSGRGIQAGWVVRLTSSGQAAAKTWPPLLAEIERRWERRFGQEEIDRLRHALQQIANKLDTESPAGLPTHLAALLSRLLTALQIEFNRESPVPLELCANTLRVLSDQPIPTAAIPNLTGCSPETSGIGWRMKPFLLVETAPNARGKVVRLSPRGIKAKDSYEEVIGKIEDRWETKFGRREVARLRKSLQGLFEQHSEAGLLLAEGLVPPPGTVRAGHTPPALGRKDVGPAARQRARDLVAQTRAFLKDPAGGLPHFPLWDMNRGFGP